MPVLPLFFQSQTALARVLTGEGAGGNFYQFFGPQRAAARRFLPAAAPFRKGGGVRCFPAPQERSAGAF